MTELELKPCPFCGLEPDLKKYSGAERIYTVECNHPCCEIKPFTRAYATQSEAVDAWNRREE